MDGDIFGAVSRLGRDAAEEVARALRGASLDPFLPARCLDVLISAAGGLPSLPAVLAVFRSLVEAPLLARTMIDSAIEAVGLAVRDANGSVLDLIVRSVAERRLLAGDFDPRRVADGICLEMLDRAIITARGGLVELEGGGPECRDAARGLLSAVASEAGGRLEARPDAKRLGLSTKYANLDSETDLVGGRDDRS